MEPRDMSLLHLLPLLRCCAGARVPLPWRGQTMFSAKERPLLQRGSAVLGSATHQIWECAGTGQLSCVLSGRIEQVET
jgi:hypothetical protein